MTKIEKAAREVISLMSTPGSCSYNEENKKRFHAAARVVLRHLAEGHLGLANSDYDLRVNLAGIAGSGEATLHTDRIYLQLGESCLGPKFMWRTCAGRKDYHGGPNQWLPYDSLSNLSQVGDILRRATCVPPTENTWRESVETHPTEMEKKEEFNQALAANGVTVVDPFRDLSRLIDAVDPAIVVRLGDKPAPNNEAERRIHDTTPMVDFHSVYCPVTQLITDGSFAAARFQRHFMPGDLKVSADTLVKNLVLNAKKGEPAGHETVLWGFGYEYGIELAVLHGHKPKEDSDGR